MQIIDLDERNQLLKTNIWLNYVWNDANLMWNEVEYKKLVYFKKGLFMASFFVVSTQLTVKQMYDKSFLMTGFKPRISGVGGDCSTN